MGKFSLAAKAARKASNKAGKPQYPLADRGDWWGQANYQDVGGVMSQKSPDDFLKQGKALDPLEEVTAENIQDLLQHINEGRTLDPLSIFEDGSIDGRHRAWAAKEMGLTEVPVIDFRKIEGALDESGPAKYHKAYHGSPHTFDKFSTENIGTGEGAAAYGHGLYFAESEGVAKSYRSKLSLPNPRMINFKGTDIDVGDLSGVENIALGSVLQRDGFDVNKVISDYTAQLERTDLPERYYESWGNVVKFLKENKSDIKEYSGNKGSLYEVNIPETAIGTMLDWDLPLSEQPKHVQEILLKLRKDWGTSFHNGDTAYRDITQAFSMGDTKAMAAAVKMGYDPYSGDFGKLDAKQLASEYLNSLGIPGIKYLDGNSRRIPAQNIIESEGLTRSISKANDDIKKLQIEVEQNLNNPQLQPAYFDKKNERITRLQEMISEAENRQAVLASGENMSRNFVLFDDNQVAITSRNGIPGALASDDPDLLRGVGGIGTLGALQAQQSAGPGALEPTDDGRGLLDSTKVPDSAAGASELMNTIQAATGEFLERYSSDNIASPGQRSFVEGGMNDLVEIAAGLENALALGAQGASGIMGALEILGGIVANPNQNTEEVLNRWQGHAYNPRSTQAERQQQVLMDLIRDNPKIRSTLEYLGEVAPDVERSILDTTSSRALSHAGRATLEMM